MILSKDEISRRIIEDKLVSGFSDLKHQLQPAGIDLTLEKIYRFKTEGKIDFDNSERKLSETEEYRGKGESALFVGNEKGMRIKKGAKVAQLIFFRLSSEAKELYSGIHLGENL